MCIKKLLTNLFVTTCNAELQEKQTEIQHKAGKIKDEKKSEKMSNTRKTKQAQTQIQATRRPPDNLPSHLSLFVMLQKRIVEKPKTFAIKKIPKRMRNTAEFENQLHKCI